MGKTPIVSYPTRGQAARDLRGAVKKFKPFDEKLRVRDITYNLLEDAGVPVWGNGTYRYISEDAAQNLDNLIDSNSDYFSDPAEPFMDSEGEKVLRTHLRIERSSTLVRKFKNSLKSYKCEICNFDFGATYGDLGKGFIEAHHKLPLSEKETFISSIYDLAAVCSNCHRMLHRSKSAITIKELKSAMNK